MVARALWRSEALGVAGSPTKAQPCVPLISTMQGHKHIKSILTVQRLVVFIIPLIGLDRLSNLGLRVASVMNTDAAPPRTENTKRLAQPDLGQGVYHYSDVKMSAMASQITGVSIVYSTIYLGSDQSWQQSSASPAFVRVIHRWPVNSPHERPVTRNIFPFDDVIIMNNYSTHVPGGLLKWLNLITAPGSASNEPGSVTWLATKYLKTVSWRNHIEQLTTLWPQNRSFWPKINISSS